MAYNRFSVYTSAVKMPTIVNEKISFEVKFVQIYIYGDKVSLNS